MHNFIVMRGERLNIFMNCTRLLLMVGYDASHEVRPGVVEHSHKSLQLLLKVHYVNIINIDIFIDSTIRIDILL